MDKRREERFKELKEKQKETCRKEQKSKREFEFFHLQDKQKAKINDKTKQNLNNFSMSASQTISNFLPVLA